MTANEPIAQTTLDDLWDFSDPAASEQRFFDGLSVPSGTMYQYITETDGSTSTYQYESAVFKLGNAGVWKGDTGVRQKLEFYATRRRRV